MYYFQLHMLFKYNIIFQCFRLLYCNLHTHPLSPKATPTNPTHLALPRLKCHGGRVQEPGGSVLVVLEAEGHLGLHAAGVADGQCLHVLRVATLTIPTATNNTLKNSTINIIASIIESPTVSPSLLEQDYHDVRYQVSLVLYISKCFSNTTDFNKNLGHSRLGYEARPFPTPYLSLVLPQCSGPNTKAFSLRTNLLHTISSFLRVFLRQGNTILEERKKTLGCM